MIFSPYQPQSYQIPFHLSPARFKNICGGVRSGKSYTVGREGMRKIYIDVANNPRWPIGKAKPMIYWVVTPDYSIGKVMMREVFEAIYEIDPNLVISWNKSVKELRLWPNVLIEFKSAKDPKTLVAAALHGAIIDEAARLHPEAWQGGIRMRLTDYQGWALFATTPLGKNWYYEEIYQKAATDRDFENFLFLTEMNKYIPREEIMAAKRHLPKKYYEREYRASFDSFYGQVFEDFGDHNYYSGKIPYEIVNYVGGIDWGYESYGCVVVFAKVRMPVEGYGYYEVASSMVSKRLAIDPNKQNYTWLQHCLELQQQFPGVKFFPGKERPDYIQAFKDGGVNLAETDYSVILGLETVNSFIAPSPYNLGNPRFYLRKDIDPKIKDQMVSYSWKEDTIKDEVVKVNDHFPDAVRYAIHGDQGNITASSVIIPMEDPDWYEPSTFLRLRRAA